MSDTVERLRSLHMQCDGKSLYAAAADEIERLTAERDALRDAATARDRNEDALRAERDALLDAGESALRALRFYQDAHGVPPGSGYTALRAAIDAARKT